MITEDADGHIYVGGGHGLDRLDPRDRPRQAFHHRRRSGAGLVSSRLPRSHRRALVRHDLAACHGSRRCREKPPAPPPVLISALARRRRPAARLGIGGTRNVAPGFRRHTRTSCRSISSVLASGRVTCCATNTGSKGPTPTGARSSEQRTCHLREPRPGPLHVSRPRRELRRDRERSNPRPSTFTILSPVWQRWWFLALVALAVGLTVYALYRYRVARLLEMANMRTRIATDLHDDIGANLTRIALLSEVAARSRAASESARAARGARRPEKMDRSRRSPASPASRSAR